MNRLGNAPTDLLFGVIAVHNDLVAPAVIPAALRAREPGRSLAERLVAQGALTATQRDLVETLAGEYVKRHGGDAEKTLTTLIETPSTRERLNRLGDPELSDALDTVVTVGSTIPRQDDLDRDDHAALAESGRRYRVLRGHARGGLGEVFVALDSELNREVALKRMQDRYADDPVSRRRFLVEAEITGGLEHPGIVPVYGLGTYDGGRPYYAMRFIKGDSLKDAIQRFHGPGVGSGREAGREPPTLPSTVSMPYQDRVDETPGRPNRELELRRLLRRFLDVCNTIDYAHSRGVLHRDIKPANIIVGKFGETLVVDWGLAKPLGRVEPDQDGGERVLNLSSASGSVGTLPGSALGTPAYMSPEQARGDLDRLGSRSDVYSLGATLYCLLTGRPPYERDDLDEVLGKVRRGDFPPPRSLDPALDPALEAICLKAMALEPENRFASARALAEDVERWMADEPVCTWREPWPRRARRWARRHRTAVTAATAAVLVALAGTAAVLAVQSRANADLMRANYQLESAYRKVDSANTDLRSANAELATANQKVTRANVDLKSAGERERQRFDLAMEAIKLFHGEVSQDLLLKEKQFEGLRSKLLKGAADYYGRLERLLKGQADPQSRAALGRAYFELGELTGEIGKSAEAVAVHLNGLAVRRELAGRPGADAEAELDVVRSLNGLGTALNVTDREADESAAYREAVERAEALTASGRGSDEAHFTLAQSLDLKASTRLFGGRRPEENLALERRALAIMSEQVAKDPSSWRYLEELGHCQFLIGVTLAFDMGQPAEGLEAVEKAVAVYQKLADSQPEVYRWQNKLAQIHNNISASFTLLGRHDEAIAARRRAVAIWRRAADANPAVSSLANNLAFGLNYLATRLTEIGRPADALEPLAEARPILRRLNDADPRDLAHPSNLAYNYSYAGDALARLGRWRQAEAEYRAALVLFRQMADTNPALKTCRGNLAWGRENLGGLLSDTGKWSEAMAEYGRALSLRQELAAASPAAPRFQRELAESLLALGSQLAQAGKTAEAIGYCARGEAIRQKLAVAGSATAADKDALANCQTLTADVLRRSGRLDEAQIVCERALSLRERLVKAHPEFLGYRAALGETYVRLGQVRRDLENLAGAADAWKRASTHFDRTDSLYPEQTFIRACCHAGLAGLAGRPGSGVSAAEGADQSEKAMAGLRQAVATGYRNPDGYRTESALDPLRDRPDFRLVILDLAFPSEPFAEE